MISIDDETSYMTGMRDAWELESSKRFSMLVIDTLVNPLMLIPENRDKPQMENKSHRLVLHTPRNLGRHVSHPQVCSSYSVLLFDS